MQWCLHGLSSPAAQCERYALLLDYRCRGSARCQRVGMPSATKGLRSASAAHANLSVPLAYVPFAMVASVPPDDTGEHGLRSLRFFRSVLEHWPADLTGMRPSSIHLFARIAVAVVISLYLPQAAHASTWSQSTSSHFSLYAQDYSYR